VVKILKLDFHLFSGRSKIKLIKIFIISFFFEHFFSFAFFRFLLFNELFLEKFIFNIRKSLFKKHFLIFFHSFRIFFLCRKPVYFQSYIFNIIFNVNLYLFILPHRCFCLIFSIFICVHFFFFNTINNIFLF